METRNDYIKRLATEKGIIDNLEYFIVPNPIREGLNGYVNFPKRPVSEGKYGGILTYVPVHGGITYATEDKKGMMYGFDTNHCDSDEKPIDDINWIKKQIEIMIRGILLAQKIEKKYLKCKTNEEKAKYAQKILDLQKDEPHNMGVMLNLLSGKL